MFLLHREQDFCSFCCIPCNIKSCMEEVSVGVICNTLLDSKEGDLSPHTSQTIYLCIISLKMYCSQSFTIGMSEKRIIQSITSNDLIPLFRYQLGCALASNGGNTATKRSPCHVIIHCVGWRQMSRLPKLAFVWYTWQTHQFQHLISITYCVTAIGPVY